MKRSQVRRTCLRRLDQLRLRGLRIPRPFDAESLCRRVGECLGRQITLVAVPMPGGAPSGLTFFTDTGHVIAYEQRTSQVHRDHIVAHELGHVLLGHRSFALDDVGATRLLLPTLRPALVHRVLRRAGSYGPQAEQEAEMMATVLLEEAGRPAPAEAAEPPAVDPALHARLRHGLEHPPADQRRPPAR
jgi:hypothetical protein